MIAIWLLLGVLCLFVVTVLFGAPYVPSLRKDIAVAFDELYKLSPNDVVLDLGSGDGTVLAAVSKRGAHAVGYELNPILVLISKLRLIGTKNVEVRFADMWRTPFPQNTSIIYIFSVARDMSKLEKRIQEEANRLKKPMHCISYGFVMPSQKPARTKGAYYFYTFTPLQPEKAQV